MLLKFLESKSGRWCRVVGTSEASMQLDVGKLGTYTQGSRGRKTANLGYSEHERAGAVP